MENFAQLLTVVWNIIHLPFNLFGYTISFGQVFVYTTVAGILAWMVSEVFFDD